MNILRNQQKSDKGVRKRKTRRTTTWLKIKLKIIIREIQLDSTVDESKVQLCFSFVRWSFGSHASCWWGNIL